MIHCLIILPRPTHPIAQLIFPVKHSHPFAPRTARRFFLYIPTHRIVASNEHFTCIVFGNTLIGQSNKANSTIQYNKSDLCGRRYSLPTAIIRRNEHHEFSPAVCLPRRAEVNLKLLYTFYNATRSSARSTGSIKQHLCLPEYVID